MLAILLISSIFLSIGYLFSKKVETGTDFLVAGRGLGPIILAFTIAATHFGGGALIGGIEQGAEKGLWAGTYGILGYSLACFVIAFIGPKFRRESDNLTPPDYIESRYGASKFFRIYHVSVYILGTIAIIAAQFNAFGGVVMAFGIDRTTAILIGAIVVAIYTFQSGMWGVAITDFVQLSVIILFLPIIAYISMEILKTETGVTLSELLSTPFFQTSGDSGTFLYSLIPTVLGSMIRYEYFLRFQSAKSDKDLRNASILAGVILLFLAMPIALLGAMGHKLYTEIPAAEVFGHVIKNTLPTWAGYLFLTATLAAIMSTADSLLNALSGMITRDIYHKLFNPEKDYDSLRYNLKFARITIIVGCILGVLISLKFSNIMGLLFWSAPLQTGVLFAPIIIGMFWNKATRKGAYASIIIGAIVALIDMLGIYTYPERMMVTILASSLALVVVSIYDKNTRKGGSI